jgi:hypothetical protein
VVVLRSKKKTKKDTEIAARICARYSDGEASQAVKILCGDKTLSVKPWSEEDIEPLRVACPPDAPEQAAADEEAGEDE